MAYELAGQEFVSASNELGPHLLGWAKQEDARDFSVQFLDDLMNSFTPEETLEELADRGIKWYEMFALWRYLKELEGKVPPTPKPVDPTNVLWENIDSVLDQGQTPHCVGFAHAQFGNTEPVNDNYSNKDGDTIYYECKVIDGEAGQEDGSTTRSGMLSLRQRGRVAVFAMTTKEQEVYDWVQRKGPVTTGTDWTNDMFEPDSDGRVHPTGKVAGGHDWLILGIKGDDYVCLNSWGGSWGVQGRFLISRGEYASLLEYGDAALALELPA